MLLLKLLYNEVFEISKAFNRDPRTSTLPLVGSPQPMIALLALYLLLVLKVGPKWMANRKPYDVKLYMQLYNAAQVLMNLYVVIMSVRYVLFEPSFNMSCQPYDTTDTRPEIMKLRIPAYVYYLSKYFDLFDTVFFILRKKTNQVSFLHVYHHAIMVYAVWVYITLAFASHISMTGVVNAFVHVCMYTYYFLTSTQVQLDVSWKKRLTQLQILQFLCLCIHIINPILNSSCEIDKFWLWVAFVQNIFMLLLFSDFYVRAYMRTNKNKVDKSKIEMAKTSSTT